MTVQTYAVSLTAGGSHPIVNQPKEVASQCPGT